jgi:hypothetical protein
VDGDLYRRIAADLLLKCLNLDQAKVAMGEVHDGICGTHQSAPKMKWLLQRGGFYWPTMITDYFRYYKGCEECQKFGNIQLAPTAMMHLIIKPWPFRRWRLDFIGQIHPLSLKGHRFMLVAMDYFTKRTEVVPLKNMTHKEVIISNYIEMTHYKYLNAILLICSLSTSSSNQHMTHQQPNPFPLHYLPHHHS